MKRTNTGSELITWKRLGNKPMIFNNRYIKPGQTFTARVEDVPAAFRDIIVPVDSEQYEEVKAKEDNVTADAVELEYFVKVRSAGYYDVVDSAGKVQNEKALRKAAAEELIATLKG